MHRLSCCKISFCLGLCPCCYDLRLLKLNNRDDEHRVRVYDMDGKHISPFGLVTLPGIWLVDTLLRAQPWGIVVNEEVKPQWFLAEDGFGVRVDPPKCICFVTPALVAYGHHPVGLHGTVVSGIATMPQRQCCEKMPVIELENIQTPSSCSGSVSPCQRESELEEPLH